MRDRDTINRFHAMFTEPPTRPATSLEATRIDRELARVQGGIAELERLKAQIEDRDAA